MLVCSAFVCYYVGVLVCVVSRCWYIGVLLSDSSGVLACKCVSEYV